MADMQTSDIEVAVLVFTGITTAEVLGPLAAMEVDHARYHGLAVGDHVVGFEPFHRFMVTDDLRLIKSCDVLLIGGGLGSVSMMSNEHVIGWIKATAGMSTYVLSVSTGSLLLAAAGLLSEQEAAGHWLAADVLENAGAHPTTEAIAWTGNVITTTGKAAAMEMASRLPDRVRFGPKP